MSESDRPTLVVVAGTNGSGKTTLVNALPGLIVGTRIDPDAIAREIAPTNPEAHSIAAGRIALQRTAEALAARADLTIETTLSGIQPLNVMRQAKELGYDVGLVYVGTASSTLNVARIAQRVQEGGHHIDEPTVVRRFDRSLKHLPAAAALADGVAVYDNSGEPHQLKLLYQRHGQVETVTASPPDWFQSAGTIAGPQAHVERPAMRVHRGR